MNLLFSNLLLLNRRLGFSKTLLAVSVWLLFSPIFVWAQNLDLSQQNNSAKEARAAELEPKDNNNVNSAGGVNPLRILMLMSAAIENHSYQGTLTYEFGGPLETLAFERLMSDQGTEERIRHLSGKPRNFSRSLPQDYCNNAAARLFMQVGSQPLMHLSRYYQFSTIGQNRIADRPVNLIQIQPINDDRYGFTLGIDQQSYLPLMLAVTGYRGQVLERFQFVDIDLASFKSNAQKANAQESMPLNQEAQSSNQEAKSFNQEAESFNQEHKPSDMAQKLPFTQARCEAPQSLAGWLPSWLPAGFVVASARTQKDGTAVLSFTDGLASVSIFVMPIAKATGAVGVVKRGATVAAMTMVALNQQSFKVSVVGEVPPDVARRVASSMVYRQ